MSARDNTGYHASLGDVLDYVKYGRNLDLRRNADTGVVRTLQGAALAKSTNIARKMAGGIEDEYRAWKSLNLHAGTFSGLFRMRRGKSLIEHTGLVGLDIDHVGEGEALRDMLARDRKTAFVFVSPSGDGVKLFAAVRPLPRDAAEHGDAYDAVAAHYAGRYSWLEKNFDAQTRDVTRLCFFARDEDAFIRQSEWIDQVAWRRREGSAVEPSRVSATDNSALSALRAIPISALDAPNSGREYAMIVLAAKAAGVPEADVRDWARPSPKFDENQFTSQWQGVPHTLSVSYLYKVANRHGWRGKADLRVLRPIGIKLKTDAERRDELISNSLAWRDYKGDSELEPFHALVNSALEVHPEKSVRECIDWLISEELFRPGKHSVDTLLRVLKEK